MARSYLYWLPCYSTSKSRKYHSLNFENSQLQPLITSPVFVPLNCAWFELKAYIHTLLHFMGNAPLLLVAILFMFQFAEIFVRAQNFENPKSLVISPNPQNKVEKLASKPNTFSRTIG